MLHQAPFNHIFEEGVVAPRWLFRADGTASLSYGTTGVTLAGANFGVGVAPSSWGSGYAGVEVGRAGNGLYFNRTSNDGGLAVNGYYDGTNWRYNNTGSFGLFTLLGSGFVVNAAASGTAGNAITLTQILGVSLGNSLALQGASTQAGTGITFPSAQSASSNANTLDDYEEGTWTPYDYHSGAALNGVSNATYTKIGRMVHITIGFHAGSNASDANHFLISNLPFTPSGPASSWLAGAQYGFTSLSTQPGVMVQHNDTAIYAYQNGDGTTLTRAEVFGANLYGLSFCYPTAT